MPDRRDTSLTWMQRRDLELELWVEDHLRALADVPAGTLDDPGGLAAIESRARLLADSAARLRRLRGDASRDEQLVAEFRRELDELDSAASPA